MRGRDRFLSAGCAAGLYLALPITLLAQININLGARRTNSNSSPTNTNSSDPATPVVIRDISGRVANALTGAPVPRALVQISNRTALTDAQGKFAFPSFSAPNAFATVTKPGYSATLTPENAFSARLVNLDVPIELKLYPNAIVTGIVTGPDSLPLSRTQIRLNRLTFDTTGQRWQQAGFTQSDVRGEYRFSVPAGRYRITTGYAARSVERGEAVLPVTFPPSSASNTETFELVPGELRQVDLRPRVSPGYPVSITIDGTDNDRGIRLTATGANGIQFQIQAQRADDVYTAQLPAGTFTIRGTSGGDRGDALAGEARVTITPHVTAQTILHMAPNAEFPVELAFDIVAPAQGRPLPSTPTLQNFNLLFHDDSNTGDGFSNDVRVTIKPDKTASFKLPPGRYRLGGFSGSLWHVRSATLGVTDLLTNDLLVAPGAAGEPIRLIVTNGFGSLKGSVTIAGQPASGMVYLIPLQPDLVPYSEIQLQTDGTFQWFGAPGKYIAVAAAQQVHEDFRNAAFLRKFTATGREVEVPNGPTVSLDLTLAPAGVAR